MTGLKLYPVLLVFVAACGDALPRTSLIPNQSEASAEVRDACRLTEIKCSRCHTLGRIISFDATTRAEWEPIVTRMRQMTSSGITKADTQIVLRCLADGRQGRSLARAPCDRDAGAAGAFRIAAMIER